jgi:hypothetical protein
MSVEAGSPDTQRERWREPGFLLRQHCSAEATQCGAEGFHLRQGYGGQVGEQAAGWTQVGDPFDAAQGKLYATRTAEQALLRYPLQQAHDKLRRSATDPPLSPFRTGLSSFCAEVSRCRSEQEQSCWSGSVWELSSRDDDAQAVARGGE